MVLTPDEFRANQEEYIKLSRTEDVYVVKDGRVLFKLSNPTFDVQGADTASGSKQPEKPETCDAKDE